MTLGNSLQGESLGSNPSTPTHCKQEIKEILSECHAYTQIPHKDFYVLPFIIRINKSMDTNILGVLWKLKISSISDLKNKLKLTRDLSAHRSKGSMHLLALSLKHTYTYKGLSKRKEKYTYMEFYRGC